MNSEGHINSPPHGPLSSREFESEIKARPVAEAETLENSIWVSQRELAELTEAATIGMASLAIAHDLGNSLNSMFLQASIIEMQVPEQLKEKVAMIRTQGAEAAAILRPLQRVRFSGKQTHYPVDVNSVVRQVFTEMKEQQDRIELRLDPVVVPLVSTRTNCFQLFAPLCNELRRQALAAKGRLVAETTARSSGGELALTVTGPGSDTAKSRTIEVFSDEFMMDMNEIERLAVQSLVKLHDMELSFQMDGTSYQKLVVRWK